jgi:HSP20 family protein
MNIAIREPWHLLNRLNRELDGVYATARNATYVPAVDVHEEKERFVVQADLPGVKPEDVEITADKGVLTLRGERKASQVEKQEGYERRERVTGSFTRRFTLPENVQTDAITAKFAHGVLEVSIPKAAVAAPKRVVVEH